MGHVSIPFSREMRQAIVQGRKCCTTRCGVVCDIGDTFLVASKTYRVLCIEKRPLKTVRNQLFRMEGCESPPEFETLWRRLHRGCFSADSLFYVYWFARVDAEGGA